jgi:hypothetical protein
MRFSDFVFLCALLLILLLVAGAASTAQTTQSQQNVEAKESLVEGRYCNLSDYNYVLISRGDWNITGNGVAPTDATSYHNFPPSIKITSGDSGTENNLKEHSNNYVNVSAGDTVVVGGWLKVGATVDDYGYGSLVGFDFYGPSNRIMEVHPRSAPWVFSANPGGGQAGQACHVPYGSDYTYVEETVVVPNITFTHNDYGEALPGGPQQICGLIPWASMSWRILNGDPAPAGLNAPADSWFSDLFIYVNPETEPEPDTPIEPPPIQYYTVVVNTTVGGSAEPAGTNPNLQVGGTFWVHASAYEDYTFSHWLKNGVQVSTNPNYPITDGMANVVYEMTAYFTANPPSPPDTPDTPGAGYYTVNVEAGTGGSVNVSGVQTLSSSDGETLTVTAKPSANSRFTYWLYDGSNISASRTVTVGPEASDTAHTLKAIFQYVEPPPPNQFVFPASASFGVIGGTKMFTKLTGKLRKQKPIDFKKFLKE